MAEENFPQGAPDPAQQPQFQPQTAPQQPAQQGYGQPQPQPQPQPGYAPQPQRPMPGMQAFNVLTELSGGMKFGWLIIGSFMGLTGILLAWLTNASAHPEVKSGAIKFAVIGLVINIILSFIVAIFAGAIIAAIVSDPYYYY